MLDNGYIYLVVFRMFLFWFDEYWVVVFEIFGFLFCVGYFDLVIVIIFSKLNNRNKLLDYIFDKVYNNYLKNNLYWEMRNFWFILNDDWIDKDNLEFVVE